MRGHEKNKIGVTWQGDKHTRSAGEDKSDEVANVSSMFSSAYHVARQEKWESER